MSKILFLTTAHKYNDDRIFYHQAKELIRLGYEVKICSLSSDYQGIIDDIFIESYSILNESSEKKIQTFQKICDSYQPDCIISSEPLAVIATKKHASQNKTSIIYDITEWYPSLRMLQAYSFFPKIIHAIIFFAIQVYAGFLSTHFIFGEETKKFPLGYLFPFKKKLTLPYYPDDSYIYKNIRELKPDEITLCYTGRISKEDGIENFFNAIDILRKRKPNLKINILIIGAPKRENDKMYFSSLIEKYKWDNITIKGPVPYELFTQSYNEADICFDLREHNIEYNYCLPIKLFYYIAVGKPVIYTNLKAIKKHIDITKFGYSVDPENSELIAQLIIKYLENTNLYNLHANNARKEYEEKYNWNNIRPSFIDFIRKSIK